MNTLSVVAPATYHPGVIPDEEPAACEGCGLRSYDTCTWDDQHCETCQEGT